MFHVLAWTANVDPNGSMVALESVHETAIFSADTFHRVPEKMPYLIGHGALINDASAARARLISPSLLLDGGHDIEPVVPAGQYGVPPEVLFFVESPLLLEPNENLEAWVQYDPAGAARSFVHAWICDGFVTPVFEEVFTVRATAAVDQDNFVWKHGEITFSQTLPQGRYLVVGMRCRANSGQIARLIFRDQLGRPGCPIVSGISEPDAAFYRYGNLGVWGHFRLEDPPELEIFHGTATSQTLILDLVRF